MNNKNKRLIGDPGVRKEIIEYVENERDLAVLGKNGVVDASPSHKILITCDYAFALACFGEDISCLLLQKKYSNQHKVNHREVASFIHEYAIGTKYALVLKGLNSEIEIRGFWPEKTFYDLLKRRVQYRVGISKN